MQYIEIWHLWIRGRVLFILVNFVPSHAPPEEKLEKVDASIEKFRKALDLEPNKTDAQFNLAQALHQKSEILQETTEIDNSYGLSAMALQEAMSIFDHVYELQEKEYMSLNEPKQEEQDGDVEMEESTEEMQVEEPTADKTPEEFTTVTKVESTTPFSLIDTLLSTVETMSTMASMLASFPASMELFSRAKAKIALAEKWYEKIHVEEGDQDTEKQKKATRIQINLKEAAMYAAMADRTLVASNSVEHSLFDRSIERLNEIIDTYDPRNVEAMCDRGDIMTSYGQAIVELANKKHLELVPEKDGKEVWQLYTSATKSFQAALGIEPKNIRILNKMGDLSLIRARLELPVAKRNQLQLLKNAQFYFKHAVEVDKEVITSGYLGWAMSEWALEEYAEVQGKKEDALKIIRVWIKRGGNGTLFRNLAEDNESWDEDFVEYIIEEFFDDDDDE